MLSWLTSFLHWVGEWGGGGLAGAGLGLELLSSASFQIKPGVERVLVLHILSVPVI